MLSENNPSDKHPIYILWIAQFSIEASQLDACSPCLSTTMILLLTEVFLLAFSLFIDQMIKMSLTLSVPCMHFSRNYVVRGGPWGLEILWNKKGEPQLMRTVRHQTAAPSFHTPKTGPSLLCISGTGMLQASNQLFSVIFLKVYFLAEKNICPFDFLGTNEKPLKENLVNSLCYRWHQIRNSLGNEVTGCGGEGNENWPSSHACQVAWGQPVPINVNEDWRHSATCMIKPKPKAAFLIAIALPSSFPKGRLICKGLLSLAAVSNWALLTCLPIIRWETKMCAHQLRDSGHFRGSPGLLPLATPSFLSYHFNLSCICFFQAKREKGQAGARPSPLDTSFSVGSGFEKGKMLTAWEGLRAPLFLPFSWTFPTKSQPKWKLSYVFLYRFLAGEVFITFYYFLCRNL